ncbi:hypothetical protein I8752_36570 [Nostocaceae cyanobacterium CENA369]|uniref:Uncharacterized protein n=1 Tax=Dendronalium phyllosphericum CENA369 TaxID=1725256 RepID=A0A8J7IMS6_9NOST|nr:hypothetical protein [Dendronalium phyllosphericum]MBH8578361.1 hypothetical protein [Dendronalium phyllosphericum CENA369]
MLNRLVHIQEEGIDRIINLNDVCSATKVGETLSIFMVNNARPLLFRKQAAENIWRTLMDFSTTIYSHQADNSHNYLQSSLSDNRKIFLDSLAISHDRTLSKLGGAKDIAQLRDNALLEVKLVPPTLNNPRQAFMKLPGQSFEPILLPNWQVIKNFGVTHTSQPAIDRDTLRRIWDLEFNLDPETVKRGDETVKRPDSNDFSTENRRFTRFNLTRNEAKAEILRLRNEMNINQTEIIKMLWNARPGNTETYRNAVSEYKELLGEGGD